MNTDDKEVRELFAQFLAGWNAGDGTAFAAPFTDELDFIGFDGTAFTTKAELASFHQDLFDKFLRGTRLVGEVTVRFPHPDLAVLVGRGGTIMRGKTKPSPVRDSIQTLTAIRTPTGWQLTSFQNTRLRPMGKNFLRWVITDLLWKGAKK